jgi:hypothetical protein
VHIQCNCNCIASATRATVARMSESLRIPESSVRRGAWPGDRRGLHQAGANTGIASVSRMRAAASRIARVGWSAPESSMMSLAAPPRGAMRACAGRRRRGRRTLSGLASGGIRTRGLAWGAVSCCSPSHASSPRTVYAGEMAKALMVVVAFMASASTSCGPVTSLGGDAPLSSGPPDGPPGAVADAPAAADGRADPDPDARGPSIDAGSSGEELYRSGTRIKMKMMVSEDGARVFQGNYDSQRGEECNFQPAVDGVTRCLPVSYSYASLFLDAACTLPVFVTSAAACPPKYLAEVTTDTCPSTYRFGAFYLASQVSPLPALVYGKTTTGCSTGRPVSADSAVYERSGSPIPPTSFQQATLSIE